MSYSSSSDYSIPPKRIRLDEDRSEGTRSLHCQLHLADAYEKLYMDEETADVTLIIEDTKVPVHRIILAADSKFFMRLFFGDFRESGQREIVMPDISLEAFKICLQYMYFMAIEMDAYYEEEHVMLTALEHAHRFGLKGLQTGIGKYLDCIMDTGNVLAMLKMAELLNFKTLMDSAVSHISHSESVFERGEFVHLNFSTLLLILQNYNTRSNSASEVKRFIGIRNWLQQNAATVTTEQTKTILSHVKLEYMTQMELVEIVKPSNLFDETTIQMSLQSKGFMIRQVTNCKNPEYFQATTSSFRYKASAEAMIVNGIKTNGFIVELETENIINYITFNLSQKCGYKIDISMDTNEWKSIMDYSDYLCKDLQTLHISAPVKAKFIRIYGNNYGFYCNGFKVDHILNAVKALNTFVCPPNLLSTNGKVDVYLENDSYSYNSSYEYRDYPDSFEINEDSLKMFDQNSFKKTGNPCIYFAQPYLVNVIQFFRVNDEQCTVTIILGKEKKIVVHKCKEEDENWHEIVFPAQAIMSIEIDGVQAPIEVKQLNVFYKQDI